MIKAQEAHHYWMHESAHEKYIDGADRSSLMVKLIADAWPERTISILEPGCNIGRNLYHLMAAGYEHLRGIEISPRAHQLMREFYPDLTTVMFYQGSIESWITQFDDCEFDVVFTLAVLMHIHPDSEWIFEHLARVARLGIVTLEDEVRPGSHRWPRQYRFIFEAMGFEQDLELTCEAYTNLSEDYRARRFIRRDSCL